MLLYRLAPDGLYAATTPDGALRVLYSDPFETDPADWELGREVDLASHGLLAPVRPGKIVGIGRSYRDHAAELGNPMPEEPVIFLKAPSAVIGPGAPIVLPPESARVEHEGEIAAVIGRRLTRATAAEAAAAVLGVTCCCDVTARDLQRRDATFARAKSFDTFCPLGPAIALAADLSADTALEVITRVGGEVRQHGRAADLAWPIAELVAYASRCMTLEPGDLVLTGSPAGVGPLTAGDLVEVEIPGVGVLANPVESRVAP